MKQEYLLFTEKLKTEAVSQSFPFWQNLLIFCLAVVQNLLISCLAVVFITFVTSFFSSKKLNKKNLKEGDEIWVKGKIKAISDKSVSVHFSEENITIKVPKEQLKSDPEIKK
jgi:preprotein translocase subunit YajC